MTHKALKWGKTKRFNALLDSKRLPDFLMRYNCKQKLHGTNAGIQIHPDGTVLAQGRNRICTEKDNTFGFYEFVQKRKTELSLLKTPRRITTIYGEWCGKGIQKGMGIHKVQHKTFAVFSVIHSAPDDINNRMDTYFDPGNIRQRLDYDAIAGIHTIPWFSQNFMIDLRKPEPRVGAHLAQLYEKSIARCLISESLDPVLRLSPILPSEGLVFYPTYLLAAFEYRTLMFKMCPNKNTTKEGKQ